jgi:hypothetical protein
MCKFYHQFIKSSFLRHAIKPLTLELNAQVALKVMGILMAAINFHVFA